jgi:hypothetical protein
MVQQINGRGYVQENSRFERIRRNKQSLWIHWEIPGQLDLQPEIVIHKKARNFGENAHQIERACDFQTEGSTFVDIEPTGHSSR